ncbi:MAG: L-fuculose-phosphate aldolase [Desulfobacterales bacterium]|nr:L-fuculose-phosphate aldolase [Desulfobacterales bacterium]MDJ0887790.1 L-fuculose-phosphate aldolase [Desulfobacterales bacterium]
MLLAEERQAVVDGGNAMLRAGLTTGTGGNLSRVCRRRGLVAISPSGLDYPTMRPEDVSLVDLDGRRVEGAYRPSSELGFHLALYGRRPEVGAVVHTHSVYATTLACLGWELPAVHYLVGFAGRKVPVAPYATFGTDELAANVAETLGTAFNAVLLANHGLVAVGEDMRAALNTAAEVEFVARIYYQARCAGAPVILPEHEMDVVIQKFKAYGKPRAEEDKR